MITIGAESSIGMIVGSLLLVLVNLAYFYRSRHVLYGGFSVTWGLMLLTGVLVVLFPTSTYGQWTHLLDILPGIAAFVLLGTAFLVRRGAVPMLLIYIVVGLIILHVIEIDTPQVFLLDLILPLVSAGALISASVLLTDGETAPSRIEKLLIRGAVFLWSLLFMRGLVHLVLPVKRLDVFLVWLYSPIQLVAGFLLLRVGDLESKNEATSFIPATMEDLRTALLVVQRDEVSGDQTICQANQLAAELYGYPVDELVGLSFGKLWGVEGPGIDLLGIHGSFEATHQKKDGREMNLRIHPSVVERDGVSLCGMLVTDETASTLYKRNLIQQEEQYHRIFTSIDDALIVSQGMEFRLVNPAMERLVGETSGSLRTFEDLLKFVDDPTREIMEHRLQRWAAGLDVDEFLEFRAIRADGRQAELELQSFRVPWFNNQPALITIVRDIGRHKNMERERQKMFETRLQAEQLQSQWLSLTLETSRLTSIGVIAAEITHEINQPMNAITLAADGIRHWATQNPHHFPEFAQNLLTNIGSGAKRVSDILDHLNRLYTPLDQYTLEPLDLRSILKSCIRLIDGQASSQDTQLTFHAPEEGCMINADAVQLEQLFANLMLISLNKLSQAEVKERTLVVTILVEEDGLKTAIADNGSNLYTIGNNLSVESYMRSGDTDPGDSVRLTVVRHLVERFNGTLHSRQNEMGGTTMSVLFPTSTPSRTGGHA